MFLAINGRNVGRIDYDRPVDIQIRHGQLIFVGLAFFSRVSLVVKVRFFHNDRVLLGQLILRVHPPNLRLFLHSLRNWRYITFLKGFLSWNASMLNIILI